MYLEDVIAICKGKALMDIMNVFWKNKNPCDLDVTIHYNFNKKKVTSLTNATLLCALVLILVVQNCKFFLCNIKN